MSLLSRLSSPFVLFSLGFLWVVLFHDLSWSLYVLGCAATAAGMMALLSSAEMNEPAGGLRRVLLLCAACAGAVAALLWGLSLSPLVVGIVALLTLHVPGFAGLWIVLRGEGQQGEDVGEPGPYCQAQRTERAAVLQMRGNASLSP